MQNEEKMLNTALEAMIMRVYDLKNSIAAMLLKLEHEYETLNWPTFLDNFALIAGHLTSLSKLLSHDKAPNLRNLTVLPLLLSPEKDDDLIKMTEGRITTFAHDLVPNYLRTKPEPQAEQKMIQLEHKAANLAFDASQDCNKQIAQYTKCITQVYDIAEKAREEWESEATSRTNQTQTSNNNDTQALVAAVGLGKGLKNETVQMVQSGVNPGSSNMMVGRPGSQPGAGGQVGQMGKAPSTIKTNIKAASQQQIHPYAR
ncbi:mediator of RNA polymerase II transcription subunit 8 isoform X1 [Cotesia glomerata]|uniref:mediator of RNA polymerase II transcription subunit 8 isoform X1 n=1 Tax=Cotesia glomerata TaxID=32391 RepID=UPI001D02B2D8|nr:mediator of RNA polymerase II transcription subunit 8 isoform X1 [Cotesia glomerata]